MGTRVQEEQIGVLKLYTTHQEKKEDQPLLLLHPSKPYDIPITPRKKERPLCYM